VEGAAGDEAQRAVDVVYGVEGDGLQLGGNKKLLSKNELFAAKL